MVADSLMKPVLAAILLVGCATASEQQGPVVTTKAGSVRGTVLKSLIGNEFFSFKGIPYAQPPVGDLRLRLPEPHEGWPGVRDASEHGSRCTQPDMFTGQLTGNEDCLFLNIYTPRLPSDREDVELPVMVWVHGGGFVVGEGNAVPMTGPEYLLDQQVVLVTFNYRLGPFGFFTTGDEAAPGNYGLHDQVMALRWVKDNIEMFGGDPDQVTIFGESAGGASVSLLVLSPQTRGLFARAISQSGAATCNFAANGVPQGRLAKQHAELLGCDASSSQAIVDCLRQKPVEEIMKVMPQLDATMVMMILAIPYKPRVDAEAVIPFLPEDPYTALQKGRFNLVPWMSGMTQDEGASNTGMVLTMQPDVFQTHDWSVWANRMMDLRDVTDDPEATAKQIYRFYYGEDSVSEENIKAAVHLMSDRTFTACVSSENDLASAHTPVYSYILDHTGPGRQKLSDMLPSLEGTNLYNPRDLGVSHADDLPYLFKGIGEKPVEVGSDRHHMVRFMVSVWTSFARNGYPSSDVITMPRWPVYTAAEQQHMRLNSEPSVGHGAFTERARFWKTLNINESWRAPIIGRQNKDEL